MLFGYEVELHRDREAAALVVAAPPVPPGAAGIRQPRGNSRGAGFVTPVLHVDLRDRPGLRRTYAGTMAARLLGDPQARRRAHGGSSFARRPRAGDRGRLIQTFMDHGLPETKAKAFLEHTCFARRSEDVFNAPFIHCEDGRLCFVVAGAASLHLAFAVMSQLSALRCNVSWKGQPFEESVIEVLRNHGVDASGTKRYVNGKEIQIDCVAHWGNILFVYEDKNYSLPGDNAQPEYWFLCDLADAAWQVTQKVQAIEAYPEMVREGWEKT